MGATAQHADEYSPRAAIDQDPDAGTVIGKSAAIHEAPMTGESAGVLPGHFVGRAQDVAYALFGSTAPAEFYLEHHADYKYADDLLGLLGPQLTPQPVPGAEQQLAALNTAAADPYRTKEPKVRTTDQPSAGTIQANLAASPGDLLPSSESAMMSLLFDF